MQPGLQGATIRLSRLHRYLGEVAQGQECGAANNGQEPACPRTGRSQSVVSDQPPSPAALAACSTVCEAYRSLCLLRHHREHAAARALQHPSPATVAKVVGTANAQQATLLGSLLRASRALPAAFTAHRSSLRQRQRISCVKNRKREICTSGSVGGEGGNILTYPAGDFPHFATLMRATHAAGQSCFPLHFVILLFASCNPGLL